MEQHAVPQNITSYQFHLIGDMTVRQFIQLAGGIIIAWITISSKMPSVIKWPIAVTVAFFGFALAFLPVEERPLGDWIKNFILSLYRPTLYVWKKLPPAEPQAAPSALPAKPKITAPIQPATEKLNLYLKSLDSSAAPSPLDQELNRREGQIRLLLGTNQGFPAPGSSLSSSLPVPPPSSPLTNPSGIKIRPLRPKENLVLPEKNDFPAKSPVRPRTITAAKTDSPSLIVPSLEDVGEGELPPVVQAPPLAPPITVKSEGGKKDRMVNPVFAQNIPLPVMPNQPNLLSGIAVNLRHQPIVGAILEIKNTNQETIRALKTNRLGQFFTATSLANGQYELHVEHPDYAFDIIKLEMAGKTLSPLKIVGRSAQP